MAEPAAQSTGASTPAVRRPAPPVVAQPAPAARRAAPSAGVASPRAEHPRSPLRLVRRTRRAEPRSGRRTDSGGPGSFADAAQLAATPAASWPATSGRGLAAATAAGLETEPDGRATVVFPEPAQAGSQAALARSRPTTTPARPPAARAPATPATGPRLASAEDGAPTTTASSHRQPGAHAATTEHGGGSAASNGAPPGRRGTAADHVELDEIYEQVLERLRRDLVVERERAGHLAGGLGWGV